MRNFIAFYICFFFVISGFTQNTNDTLTLRCNKVISGKIRSIFQDSMIISKHNASGRNKTMSIPMKHVYRYTLQSPIGKLVHNGQATKLSWLGKNKQWTPLASTGTAIIGVIIAIDQAKRFVWKGRKTIPCNDANFINSSFYHVYECNPRQFDPIYAQGANDLGLPSSRDEIFNKANNRIKLARALASISTLVGLSSLYFKNPCFHKQYQGIHKSNQLVHSVELVLFDQFSTLAAYSNAPLNIGLAIHF